MSEQADKTPVWLAEEMVRRAEITPAMTVLEPCAGTGTIAQAVHRISKAWPVCVELNFANVMTVRRLGFPVTHADLFKMPVKEKFNRIVMNPPLKDVPMIRRALDFLAPGGRLVSVFNPKTISQYANEWTHLCSLISDMHVYELPTDCFTWNGEPRPAATMVIDL